MNLYNRERLFQHWKDLEGGATTARTTTATTARTMTTATTTATVSTAPTLAIVSTAAVSEVTVKVGREEGGTTTK